MRHGMPDACSRALGLNIGMVLAVLAALLAMADPASGAAPAALTQMPPPQGCVANTAQSGCTVGRSLDHPSFITLSPDGAFAYVTAYDSGAINVFSRDAGTGVLRQLSGPSGCVAQNGDGVTCADGRALNGAVSVAFSPDGAFVYVASRVSQAIAIFSRNAATGTLSQIGCLAGLATAASEECSPTSLPLGAVNSVSMSPDGKQLYAGAFDLSGAISTLARDPATGMLTMTSCIRAGGGAGCAAGRGLGFTFAVKASADGGNVYSTEWGTGGVASFARAAGGALTQLPGPAGCTLDSGDGTTCADGVGLRGAINLEIGPGGSQAYVAANESDAITVYSRGAGGALTLTQCQSAAALGSCQVARGLDGVQGVAVSPSGDSLHSSSVRSGNAVSSFSRDGSSGALSQLAESDGCISATGSPGCQTGVAMLGNGYVALSADGRFAYATAADSDAVSTFARGPRPTASFTLSPNPARVGESVRFDASASGSPGGSIARYQWDLDGDGSFETDGGASPTTSRSYASAGARRIRLRVTDGQGNSDEAARTLSVDVLAITTTASPGITLGAGRVTDTATVTGRVNPQPGATISFKLYGPGDATCSAAPVFESTVAYPAAGGPVTSGSFAPAAAGTYRWRAFYSGDANNAPVAGECNESDENVVVNRATPAIATKASPGVTLGAGRLTDTATVSGRVNPQQGATIDFKLYGPGDTTCAAAPVFQSLNVAYPVAGGTVSSAAFSPTAAGVYRWRAFYSGDANNAPAAGACGDPSELSTVTASPRRPTPGTPPGDGTPLLGELSLSPARFRAARSGASAAARVGSTVSYRLSEPAEVEFRILRAAPGRRVGARCVKAGRSGRRGRRCTVWRTMRGVFTQRGEPGRNTFRFTGRLRGRRLAPGRYRLSAVATGGAAKPSRPKRAGFRIVRR